MVESARTTVPVDNGAMTSSGANDELAVPEVSADPDDLGYPPSLLYRAAKLYYEDNATQAVIASTLGTSRTTVSRLLAEARRQGIVQIDVVEPRPSDDEQSCRPLADPARSRRGVPVGRASSDQHVADRRSRPSAGSSLRRCARPSPLLAWFLATSCSCRPVRPCIRSRSTSCRSSLGWWWRRPSAESTSLSAGTRRTRS